MRITSENSAIEVPETSSDMLPLMMSFAELNQFEGLRYKGQTYMGSTGASSGETGDFEND